MSENTNYLNGFTHMSRYFQASDFQTSEYTQSTDQTLYLHTCKFASLDCIPTLDKNKIWIFWSRWYFCLVIGQHHWAHLSWTVFSLSSADLTNWHFSVDLVGLVIKLNQLIMIIVHMYESLYLITSLLMNRYCYCSYERVIVLNYSVCAKQTNCVISY